MREIKFRAWDGKRMMDGDIVPAPLWYKNSVKSSQSNLHIVSQHDKDRVLMQYTGLKDKNGVDIYEGDILAKFPKVGTKHRIHKVVEWHNTVNSSGWNIAIGARNYEVIGDIYQNPELLK